MLVLSIILSFLSSSPARANNNDAIVDSGAIVVERPLVRIGISTRFLTNVGFIQEFEQLVVLSTSDPSRIAELKNFGQRQVFAQILANELADEIQQIITELYVSTPQILRQRLSQASIEIGSLPIGTPPPYLLSMRFPNGMIVDWDKGEVGGIDLVSLNRMITEAFRLYHALDSVSAFEHEAARFRGQLDDLIPELATPARREVLSQIRNQIPDENIFREEASKLSRVEVKETYSDLSRWFRRKKTQQRVEEKTQDYLAQIPQRYFLNLIKASAAFRQAAPALGIDLAQLGQHETISNVLVPLDTKTRTLLEHIEGAFLSSKHLSLLNEAVKEVKGRVIIQLDMESQIPVQPGLVPAGLARISGRLWVQVDNEFYELSPLEREVTLYENGVRVFLNENGESTESSINVAEALSDAIDDAIRKEHGPVFELMANYTKKLQERASSNPCEAKLTGQEPQRRLPPGGQS